MSYWRRSVSAPPARIYSTQRGRGPTRPGTAESCLQQRAAHPRLARIKRPHQVASGPVYSYKARARRA